MAKEMKIDYYDHDGVLVSYNQGRPLNGNTECNIVQLILLNQGQQGKKRDFSDNRQKKLA